MTRDINNEVGPVTHDEAEQLALACIDAAFNNAPRADGRRFRASIPVNPREDTDVRLMAYIKQQRAKEADQPAPTETADCTCGSYGRRDHTHACWLALCKRLATVSAPYDPPAAQRADRGAEYYGVREFEADPAPQGAPYVIDETNAYDGKTR